MNALTDPGIIQALYKASQAGVKIDLLVRGVCRLRPGIPGISDNIRVVSFVGRFLDQSRVFSFCAGGRERCFISSADWMERNLHRRVELCIPLQSPPVRQRVIEEGLETYLKPGIRVWELQSDGSWTLCQPDDENHLDAQSHLLRGLSG